MKKTVLLLGVFFLSSFNAFSQEEKESTTLFETVSGIKKKTDRFNLFLNTKSGFTSSFGENGLDNPGFSLNQFRIEAKGTINDRVSYRWRQRLNRSNYAGSVIDNAPSSIDFAYIGYKISPKFTLLAGKQAAAFGGVEYDLNPIDVYGYSRFLSGNVSGFFTGLSLYYQMTDEHELVLQVTNSMNDKFEITYSGIDPKDADKLPLAYTLSWNGSFFNNLYNTRWSASLFNQTKHAKMFYATLGNQFNFSRDLNMYFDIMYSAEGIDRRSIITDYWNVLNKDDVEKQRRLRDVHYLSFVSRLNYMIAPKLNLFVKGMYETAALYSDANGKYTEGNYLTSLGYQFGLEFFPTNDNLRFAVSYMGHADQYRFADKFLFSNELFVGFVYKIPVF